jgi:hypothetical protein
MISPSLKPKEIAHDETPSIITDHPFDPKGEWWSLCQHKGCNLARSAHKEVKTQIRYYSDDLPEED